MLQGYRGYPYGGLGNLYAAKASVTALAAYTATALGGPLLWNGSLLNSAKGVTAYLLAVSFGVTTVPTVAGSIGLTGGSGQAAAPGGNTPIGISGNLNPAGPTSQCTPFSSGTVGSAGTFYLPMGQAHTGALTVDTLALDLANLGMCVTIPPQCWAAPAAGAALTTSVIDIGLVWLEIPNE